MTGQSDSRLCVATSYTSNYADIGGYCAMSLHLYAARWQCAVHVETALAMERPPAWRRVRLIPELFERGYEYVLWLDADALFVRFDKDVLDELRPDKQLYPVEHNHPDHPGSNCPSGNILSYLNLL